MLSVEFSNPAKRFLKKLDLKDSQRLIEKIELLATKPFPKDVKRVVNRKEKVFRIRVGEYRILYVVLYERDLLFIADIDKRPRVY